MLIPMSQPAQVAYVHVHCPANMSISKAVTPTWDMGVEERKGGSHALFFFFFFHALDFYSLRPYQLRNEDPHHTVL